MLTGVNAVGYIATRTLGAGRGLAVTGLAGGFVSASATTGAMAVRARTPAIRRAALAAALLASVSTLVQLVGLVAVAYPPLLPPVIPMAAVGAIVLLAIAWAVARGGEAPADTSTEDDAPLGQGRLFALVPALILAGLLTAATLAARWGVDVFGPSGIVAAAGVAGFADAHAGGLAAATVLREGAITTSTALIAIGAALVTNTVVKIVLAFVGGGGAVGWRYAGLMLGPIISVGVTLAVTVLVVG